MMSAPTRQTVAAGPNPIMSRRTDEARPAWARPEMVRSTRNVEIAEIHMAMEKNIGARPRP